MGVAHQTAWEMPVALAEEGMLPGEAWIRTPESMAAEVRPAWDSWAFAGLQAARIVVARIVAGRLSSEVAGARDLWLRLEWTVHESWRRRGFA